MTVATHASRKVRKPDIAHHWDGIRGGWLRVVGGKEYKLDHAPVAHRAPTKCAPGKARCISHPSCDYEMEKVSDEQYNAR